MSTDPMAAVGAMQQMTATLATLGQQLSSAAPTGGFASVLAQVNTEIESLSGETPATTPTPSTEASLSSVLTGGAGTAGAGGGLVSAASVDPSAIAAGTSPVPTGSAVVADAEKYLGVPYQWGGTDPATGLDCSGLVQRVYSDLGVALPRTSQEQATVGTPVSSVAAAQPGDLVFYEPSSTGPGHVGIYIGNGMMINAPHTGTDVSIAPVGQPSQIRRILPSDSGSSVPAPAVPYLDAAASAYGTVAGGSVAPAMSALGVPASLQPLFAEAGARYGIDPTLLAAVAKQESGFQPGAVSGAGAQGLMQLMPATAAGLGVSPFDPASAIDGAAQLLSGYLQRYGGSVPDALAAYNAGPGAVAANGGVPPYAETENYVSNITSMLASVGDTAVTA